MGRILDNMKVRKMFGLKTDEVREEWRKLCNEELRDLYSSPYTIKVINQRRTG
jgi:hypothetical protein